MQLVYTVCFLLFCCEYWISVTISDYSLRIYTAHNFNIITYQFCERRCPKFLEADYFVIRVIWYVFDRIIFRLLL